ncbi:MAG: Bug family tripartite tricarboxylate transporter substrate binding protein [Rubrivivax sp.]
MMTRPVPIRRWMTLWALALGLGAALPGQAQTWPERAITVVVPYAAGGPTDVAVREIVRKMSEILGQTIVIDNKPGGGTMIAAQLVARAKPDGYTLLANVGATMVTGPLLAPKPIFDPLKEVVPVALLSANPLLLAASKGSGIKSMAEFLAQARAKPGQLAIASYGNGTPSHLAIELLKMRLGIDVIHVPYNGSAPAMIDVRGGRVPLIMDILPSHMKTMEAGDMVGLAVGQEIRSPLAPNVPTFEESGMPGMDISTWVGLAAPTGTPEAAIRRLSQAAQQAMSDTEMQKVFAARGMALTYGSPEEFDRRVRGEIALAATIIKSAGIKLK